MALPRAYPVFCLSRLSGGDRQPSLVRGFCARRFVHLHNHTEYARPDFTSRSSLNDLAMPALTNAERQARRRAKLTEEQLDAERAANAANMARRRAVEGPLPGDLNNLAPITGFSNVAEWEITNDGLAALPVTNDEGELTGYAPVGQLLDGKGRLFGAVSRWSEPEWWEYERNGATIIGRPCWWKDGNEYWGDERRWVLYSIAFLIERVRYESGDAGIRATEDQGRTAEARGTHVWSLLYSERGDVRRIAEWLRDTWTYRTPPRLEMSPERAGDALRRLTRMGLVRKLGGRFLIS